MSSVSKQNSPWPELVVETADGRRQRSGRSRRQIIEAMFELLREGHISPTAAAVAERANVGLRTVFRHFEDMESIFEEMTEELEQTFMPLIKAPFKAEAWRDRLDEAIDRKAKFYEMMFPMQVALAARRFGSDVLQRQYQSEIELLRSGLLSFMPDVVVEDRTLFAAIEVNLTFATWRRLREDQELTVEEATATIKRTMNLLLAGIDVD